MTPRTLTLGMTSLVLAAAALVAAPRPAAACGGTFCDSGPTAMPVDQTGENILFVMDGGYTEAHIEIQYDPESGAERFAWVVPVTVVPEFAVGSEALFRNVLAGTVPTYSTQTTFDDCGDPGGGVGDGGGEGGDFDAKLDIAGDPGGPDVVLQQTVGAFEITVLSGGTSAEIMQWLADNGYQQDPAAEPILQEYLREGLMFAAFKLAGGADTDQIHPVVLRFPDSDEACIPIRLTRIAAADDMEVRAFFLAEHRVVPRTYRHVLVNPLKIDWPNFASNYKEVITLAVDAPGADGKAFVTEYAGGSDVVIQAGLSSSGWNAEAFRTLPAVAVVDELAAQNLMYCDGVACDPGHGLVEGLLRQYLPAPEGVPEGEFWSCLRCYEAMIDTAAWDGDAFADAVQERIIDPGAHATEILQTWPYLTRMYTTVSPSEMTADPFFHQNPDLPDVAAFRQATQRVLCNQDAVWTLPDGREVYLPAGAAWPEFPDEMPWEEDVEEVPAVGAPMTLVDQTALIDALLADHNAAHGWPGSGFDPGDDETGDDGGPNPGGIDDGGGDGDDGNGGRETPGCGCRSDASPSPALALLLGFGLAGVRRRRRP